jgi:hypothetical protein
MRCREICSKVVCFSTKCASPSIRLHGVTCRVYLTYTRMRESWQIKTDSMKFINVIRRQIHFSRVFFPPRSGPIIQQIHKTCNLNLEITQKNSKWRSLQFINHTFNPLNAELNPICHLMAFLGAHLILHVSRIRVNYSLKC